MELYPRQPTERSEKTGVWRRIPQEIRGPTSRSAVPGRSSDLAFYGHVVLNPLSTLAECQLKLLGGGGPVLRMTHNVPELLKASQ
jgi:hypothetical protein